MTFLFIHGVMTFLRIGFGIWFRKLFLVEENYDMEELGRENLRIYC